MAIRIPSRISALLHSDRDGYNNGLAWSFVIHVVVGSNVPPKMLNFSLKKKLTFSKIFWRRYLHNHLVGSGRRLEFLACRVEATTLLDNLVQYRIIVPRNSFRSKQAERFSIPPILNSCRVVRGILLIMWLSPSDGGNVILACYCDLRYLEALTREYYVWSLE